MYRSSVTNLAKLPKSEIESFLDSFDTVLTDCDGVLWLDDEAIKDSPAVMNRLRDMGKRIFYVTNNSTKIRDEFVAKAKKLGFIATRDEIISTSYLAASYLKDKSFNKKVYVIGSKGITQELDLLGIKHTSIGPDIMENSVSEYVRTLQLDKEVGAVLFGFDIHFSFPKVLRAVNYLNRPGCLFLATNDDLRGPPTRKMIIPGPAAMLRSIEIVAGRDALVLGKPHTYIADYIRKNFNFNPERTLMIGDTFKTDILFGNRSGYKTLLVLTGTSSLDEINILKNSQDDHLLFLLPNFYIERLGDLLPFIYSK